MKQLLKYFLICFLLTGTVYAQKASIRGVVTDAENGEPLVGVNIILRGTYYGAASGLDGSYLITGMGDGSYDMLASMIGYKQYLYGGIEIKDGETRRIDIALETTVLSLGQDVVVVGDKPLIDATSTASSVSVTAEDLMGKIVESVSDIVGQQAGVSTSNNEIHIRGGRVDESQFIVDGLSIKDPLTGETSSLYVNPNAIKELEIITGGFNAEYGQAMSGIIDVKLKEGASRFEASFRYKTDQIFGKAGFNTDNLEFTLGGPLYKSGGFLPGELSYFVSGYLYLSNSYLPGASVLYPYREWMQTFSRRQENNLSSMAKLSWNLSQKYKLSVSYNQSANVNQGYFTSASFPYAFQEILDNYPTNTRESKVFNALWTHTINPRLFYTVNAGYFYTSFHKAVQNKHWTEYEECLDLDPTQYTARDEYGNIIVFTGDEFWDHGDAPYWYDYWSKNFTLSSAFTYQPGMRHKVKGGLEHRFTEMQVVDIYKPWLGSGLGESYDYYKVKPSDGSFYIQDMITFEGMIANIGLRYDYWFIGDYVTQAMLDPDILTITQAGREKYFAETHSLFGARFKGHLSPRLGISHPVTDNDVLYFNYGHFSQLPTYNYVYAKLNTISDNPYSLIGNPNLNPKTTVAYELGIKHKFSAASAIEFKAYYKDMFDYETAQTITSFNPLVGNYSMMMYLNMDYARSRGIELIFRQTAGRFFSGDAAFTYSITTGKSSNPDDNVLVEAGMIPEKPLSENYLSWDEPFRLIANLRFRVYEDERPRFFFNNWSLNAHIEAQSGRRYTQSVILDTVTTPNGTKWYIGTSRSDNPYGEIADPYITVDLKFNKDFYYKHMTYGFYIDIQNVFNHKVPRRINPFTGKPYDPGEIISYSYYGGRNPNEDPSRYYAPRQVMLGLFLRF